ncbi:MAG TPA: RNA polymerase sigma factor [Candidatus Krumholzibacteria bacterium]|nr:RNA polymerase sigma factor [Candidatus Krumholzibacteria bacterium]
MMNAHVQLAVAGSMQVEPTVDLDNEAEIIAGWIRGDKRAYEALVRRHMTDAFMVAYGYAGNAEDARDLSQEAFIKAYLARGRFDPTRPFYPWFHRILRNHCLNFVQRGRRNLSIDADDFHREIPSPRPNALEDIESAERKRIVHAAIARLSDDHREIIVLKTFRDLSYREISEALEIPIGTVMSRLFYARQALRTLIEEIERTGMGDGDGREVV